MSEASPKKINRVMINAQDQATFTELLRANAFLDTAGERLLEDGKVVAEAYVPAEKLHLLQKPGVEIKVLGDAVKTGIERQKEVSSMNRFALGEQQVPKGFAKKE